METKAGGPGVTRRQVLSTAGLAAVAVAGTSTTSSEASRSAASCPEARCSPPAPQGTDPDLMDTSTGTVHMIIGGGGHSTPTPVSDFDMPHDGVLITSVGPGSPQAQHPTITTTEPAPWSAYRDLQTPYGFASFDVVPHEPGGTTSITVTHYGADLGSPSYSQRDQFVMRKSLNMDQQGDRLAGAATTR